MRKEILKRAEEILASEVYGEEEVSDEVVIGIMSEFPDAEEVEFLDRGCYSDWGNSGAFTADGEEFNWILNEEEARRIAIDYVREMLEEEPELFTQDWLTNYLTISNTDIRLIAQEEYEAYWGEMSDDEFEEYADLEEYEGIEGLSELRDKHMEEEVDRMERELEDPIQYFVEDKGIYTVDELLKASFIMIDVNSAADDAVDMDGWAHFLSTYDGNYEVTENGVVYFKE